MEGRLEQSPSARFYAPAEVEQVSQSKDTAVLNESRHADLFGAFRGFEPSNNTTHDPLYYPYGPRRNSGSLLSPRMPTSSRVVYHQHQDPAHKSRQNLLNGHSYQDLTEVRNHIFSQHRANRLDDATWQPQSPPPTRTQARAHAAAGHAPPHPVSITRPAINNGLPLLALSSIPPHINDFGDIRGSRSATMSEAHRAAFGVCTPPDDLMEYNGSMPSLRPSDSASNQEPNRRSASQHALRREGGSGGEEGNGNDLRHSVEDDQDQVMILVVHGICLTVTQWYLERLRVNWRVRNGEKVSSRWQDANERFAIMQSYDGGSGSGRGKGRGRNVHRKGGIEKTRKWSSGHRPSSFFDNSSDDRRRLGRRLTRKRTHARAYKQGGKNVRSNGGSSSNNNDNASSNSHNHGDVLDRDDDDDAYDGDSDEDGYFRHENPEKKHTPPQSHYPCPRRRRHPPEEEVENPPRQQNPIPAPTTALLDNIRHICMLIWRRAQRDREDVLDAEARACQDMSVLFDSGGVIVTYCTRVAAVAQTAVEEDDDNGERKDERDDEGDHYYRRRRRRHHHHQQTEQDSDVDGVLERVLEAGKAICRVLGDQDGLQKLAQLEQAGCIEDGDYEYEDAWVH